MCKYANVNICNIRGLDMAKETQEGRERLSVTISSENIKFVKEVRASMDNHLQCNHTITDAVERIMDSSRKSISWKKFPNGDGK